MLSVVIAPHIVQTDALWTAQLTAQSAVVAAVGVQAVWVLAAVVIIHVVIHVRVPVPVLAITVQDIAKKLAQLDVLHVMVAVTVVVVMEVVVQDAILLAMHLLIVNQHLAIFSFYS